MPNQLLINCVRARAAACLPRSFVSTFMAQLPEAQRQQVCRAAHMEHFKKDQQVGQGGGGKGQGRAGASQQLLSGTRSGGKACRGPWLLCCHTCCQAGLCRVQC